MNITNERLPVFPKTLHPFALFPEDRLDLLFFHDSVYADVDDSGSGLYEISRYEGRPADSGHEDVGPCSNSGKIDLLRSYLGRLLAAADRLSA